MCIRDSHKTFHLLKNRQSSAVCFSRGGKFYEANGELLGPGNAPFGFIYLCRRTDSGHTCPVSYGGDVRLKEVPSGSFEYLSAIEWSRYGNFSRSKWDNKNDRWFEEWLIRKIKKF